MGTPPRGVEDRESIYLLNKNSRYHLGDVLRGEKIPLRSKWNLVIGSFCEKLDVCVLNLWCF